MKIQSTRSHRSASKSNRESSSSPAEASKQEASFTGTVRDSVSLGLGSAVIAGGTALLTQSLMSQPRLLFHPLGWTFPANVGAATGLMLASQTQRLLGHQLGAASFDNQEKVAMTGMIMGAVSGVGGLMAGGLGVSPLTIGLTAAGAAVACQLLMNRPN